MATKVGGGSGVGSELNNIRDTVSNLVNTVQGMANKDILFKIGFDVKNIKNAELAVKQAKEFEKLASGGKNNYYTSQEVALGKLSSALDKVIEKQEKGIQIPRTNQTDLIKWANAYTALGGNIDSVSNKIKGLVSSFKEMQGDYSVGTFKNLFSLMDQMRTNGFASVDLGKLVEAVPKIQKPKAKQLEIPVEKIINAQSIRDRITKLSTGIMSIYNKSIDDAGNLSMFAQANKSPTTTAKNVLTMVGELQTYFDKLGIGGEDQYKQIQRVMQKMISHIQQNLNKEYGYNITDFGIQDGKIQGFDYRQGYNKAQDIITKTENSIRKEIQKTQSAPQTDQSNTSSGFEKVANAAQEATSAVQRYVEAWNTALQTGKKTQSSFENIFREFVKADSSNDLDNVNQILKVLPQLEKFKGLGLSQSDATSFQRSNSFINGESIHDFMSQIPELHGYLESIGYDFQKATLSAKEFWETKGLPSEQRYRTDALSALGDKYKNMNGTTSYEIDLEFMKDVVSELNLAEDKQTVVKSIFQEISNLQSDKNGYGVTWQDTDINNRIKRMSDIISPTYKVSKSELQSAKEMLGIIDGTGNGSGGGGSAVNSDLLAREETLQGILKTIKELNQAITNLRTVFDGITPENMVSSFQTLNDVLNNLKTSLPTISASLSKFGGLNIKLGDGMSPVQRNAAFGIEQRNAISNLREQQTQLMNFYKEYYKTSDAENGQFRQLQGTDLQSNPWELFSGFDQDESLSKQMASLQNLINLLKQAQSIKGIDISSVTSTFTADADDLVNKTNDILTGKSNLDAINSQLSTIFNVDKNVSLDGINSGINNLIKALNTLKATIDSVKEPLNSLSKLSDFSEAKTSIEELVREYLKLQDIVNKTKTSNVNTKPYSDKDYVRDMKQYYKYSELQYKNPERRDEYSNLANEQLQRAADYQNQLNDQKKRGIELTKEQKAASDAQVQAEQKYNENISRYNQQQERKKEVALNKYKRESGVNKALQSADSAISKYSGNASNTQLQSQAVDIQSKVDALKAKIKELDSLFDGVNIPDDIRSDIESLTQDLTDAVAKANELAKIKPYSNKDYQRDISKYYKYLEQSQKKPEDTEAQKLRDDYRKSSQQYEDALEYKIKNRIALTKEETDALAARNKAAESYDKNMSDYRQKEISSYLKDSGQASAINEAQKYIDKFGSSSLEGVQNSVEQVSSQMERLKSLADGLDQAFDNISGIPSGVKSEITDATNVLKNQLSTATRDKIANPLDISRIGKNFESWIAQNPKQEKAYSSRIESIRSALSSENLSDSGLKQINQEIDQFIVEATRAGNVGRSFGDTLKFGFQNLARYLMTFASFYQVINVFRQAVGVVKELDAALTEMRKVSDESVSSLKDYQLKTFDMADKVGTTAVQIQNSTADWLRLGKSFEDAQNLATQSTVLLNVSEFKDIQGATEQLVSATQAYDELDASAITDKLNIIGNNFAVGTSDLAQGLQNAAAVLKTQGNDIDQALALLTAGNLIGQDISKQSAGVRTISLRIAGKLYARTYSNVWA